ncbi:MAG: hypothetical protein HYX27_13620 [Acidobacteria bacterium]|nr:hypothetical protein [Acidobacteriota bacterium]
MTRLQLEHIIRAAATIADVDEIVIIGSQAVLGQFPDAPEELLVSREADVYPRSHPERSDLIDASIGEGSPFEHVYGYYAHGVGPETAILPANWEGRLITIANENTHFVRGLCLEVHDLAISKLVAGRDKDIDFVQSLHHYSMASPGILQARLEETDLSAELHAIVAARLARYTKIDYTREPRSQK